MGSNRRIHAAVFSFIAGVIPPIPMLGRSKVGLVRRVDIWAECIKGLLPAISTSGGVAAKLRFRVCSGVHARAYGAGVVIDILLDIF
jgi:hypothetical protein